MFKALSATIGHLTRLIKKRPVDLEDNYATATQQLIDKITLNQPDLQGHEAESIAVALKAIASGSPNQIMRFEQACCEVSDRPFAIASGTPSLALQAAVLALGIEEGDEILCPALAPARLVLAITRSGATPVFVDVHPRHGAM